MKIIESMYLYGDTIPTLHFFIKDEGGKKCVHSHQTGKNFGCYETVGQAKKRLAQMKRFRSVKAQDSEELGPNTGGMGRAKALDLCKDGKK
jgi:hypothetical protein